MIASRANDIVLRPARPGRGRGRTRRTLAAAALGLAAAVLAAPPAGAQSGDLARELEIIKRDLKDLQRFVYKGDASAAPSAGAEGGESGLSGNVAGRLQVKIQELQSALREVTGRVEEVEYRIRRLDERVEKLASDVDFRLSRLEKTAGVGAGEGEAAQTSARGAGDGGAQQTAARNGASRDGTARDGEQGTTVISSQGAVQEGAGDGASAGSGSEDLDTTRILGRLETNAQGEVIDAEPGAAADGSNAAGPGDDAPTAESDAGRTASRSASQDQAGEGAAEASGDAADGGATEAASARTLPEGSVQEQYDHAFSLLRQRDYEAAEAAMRAFVERHADSPLTGNAMYWLGETYYARGKYRDAAATFLDAYTEYPDNNKASHSLLKLAMSLGALDKTDAACQAFDTLRQDEGAGERILRMAEEEAAKLDCS